MSLDYFKVAGLSNSVRKTIEFDVELLNGSLIEENHNK